MDKHQFVGAFIVCLAKHAQLSAAYWLRIVFFGACPRIAIIARKIYGDAGFRCALDEQIAPISDYTITHILCVCVCRH